MLKQSHPDHSGALSLLPLMDEDISESANFVAPVSEQALGLPEAEATSIASQIAQTADIAAIISDLGYGISSSQDRFRDAIKVTHSHNILRHHVEGTLVWRDSGPKDMNKKALISGGAWTGMLVVLAGFWDLHE